MREDTDIRNIPTEYIIPGFDFSSALPTTIIPGRFTPEKETMTDAERLYNDYVQNCQQAQQAYSDSILQLDEKFGASNSTMKMLYMADLFATRQKALDDAMSQYIAACREHAAANT